MSVEAMAWAFKVQMTDPSAKLVLLAVANFADEEGKCWPSAKKLAAMCGMSDRTVRAALGRLEVYHRLIARAERYRDDGGRTSDMITLIPRGNSSGGVTKDAAPPRQKQPDPPPARSSGLTSLEPSEEEPSDEQAPTATSTLDLIWKAAPEAARKRSSRGQTLKALEAAVTRKMNLGVIRQAVAAYYQDPDTVKEDFRFAKGVHRVVQNDFWETWAQAEGVHHLARERPLWQQRKMMEGWVQFGATYWASSFGPRPDEPGCSICPEIMAEFGYTPPARVAL